MINLERFITNLYSGIELNGEVMSLIGFIEVGDQVVVELVKYYTSFESNSVKVSFREIVKDMVTYGLMARGDAKFVLVHNHPQGTEQASMNDRKMKERLGMVAEFLGVSLVGSYIYITGRSNLIDIQGVTEIREEGINNLIPEKRVVSNNLYLNDGGYRYPEMDVLVEFREYEEERKSKDWYNKQLSGMVLDRVFLTEEGSKLGLVLLDKENKIMNVIDTDDFVNEEEYEDSAQMCMPIKKVSFLLEEGYRYLLYDMRTDEELERIRVSRGEDGVALDVLIITRLMGIMDCPIDYYMH